MIRKDTVFVLGAGASQAYGFPSGAALVDRICEQLQDPSGDAATILLTSGRFSVEQLKAFRRRLLESRLNSIDAFLQRRPEYMDLGKAAIAQELLQCENEERLYPPKEHDWYRALFNQLLPTDPDTFRNNQLKILTFNFDRSFEHALFRSLETLFDDVQQSFGGGRNRPVEMLQMLPLLHLHGHLGVLGPPSAEGEVSRPYAPTNSPDWIRVCSSQLKVINDEIPEKTLATAWSWLKSAEVVCFLGFGFHDLNLDRLRVKSTLSDKKVLATGYGLGDGAKGRVRRWVPNVEWSPRDWDIVKFLDETDIIHG